MENNENLEVCRQCGGKCCAYLPGIYLPADFGQTWEEIEEKLRPLFEKELLSIDWWEGNGEKYFVRPRIVSVDRNGTEVRRPIFHGAWAHDGDCSFLEIGRGCKLCFEERPFQCRALVPSPDGRCRGDGHEKLWYAQAWAPYEERLLDLAVEYDEIERGLDAVRRPMLWFEDISE